MGLRKLLLFRKPKSLRNFPQASTTKDCVASASDDTHKSHGYAYSRSSNSSLSCSLGEEPVLTTVATVVTDGIAVSTFVQYSNAATFMEDGIMVEDGSSCYSHCSSQVVKAFDYLPEIQDDGEIAAAALLDELQNNTQAVMATPNDDDDCTDAAIASSDDVDATDKAVDGAIVDAALEDECKLDESSPNNNNNNNLWLCVNNQETIRIANQQQQPTNEMFVCLTTTWNLCGGGVDEQLSFLSKSDDDAVMKKEVAVPVPVDEAAITEELKEDKTMPHHAEEKQPEDDDDSSGMEVALFTTTETDVGQPEILPEPQPSERRYSIDSFSGDILAEEKLLPRAMEVLAKRQHDLEPLDEIEVQV